MEDDNSPMTINERNKTEIFPEWCLLSHTHSPRVDSSITFTHSGQVAEQFKHHCTKNTNQILQFSQHLLSFAQNLKQFSIFFLFLTITGEKVCTKARILKYELDALVCGQRSILQYNTLKEKFVSLGKSTSKPWVSSRGTWSRLLKYGQMENRIAQSLLDPIAGCWGYCCGRWGCCCSILLILHLHKQKRALALVQRWEGLSSSSVDIINDKTHPEERSKSVVLNQRALANFRRVLEKKRNDLKWQNKH